MAPGSSVPLGGGLRAQPAHERKAKPSLDPSWQDPFPVVTLSCHEQPKNSQRRKLGAGRWARAGMLYCVFLLSGLVRSVIC